MTTTHLARGHRTSVARQRVRDVSMCRERQTSLSLSPALALCALRRQRMNCEAGRGSRWKNGARTVGLEHVCMNDGFDERNVVRFSIRHSGLDAPRSPELCLSSSRVRARCEPAAEQNRRMRYTSAAQFRSPRDDNMPPTNPHVHSHADEPRTTSQGPPERSIYIRWRLGTHDLATAVSVINLFRRPSRSLVNTGTAYASPDFRTGSWPLACGRVCGGGGGGGWDRRR
ncbi:hypothetical protein L226DRAFT_326850 [Lentinus tigrinus ALCF2SS1-7]|uniref:Uncharacterized protein n=1 Tax=Lentinus tigrinus ALCF2SS1-6 TaxID=1328759 RepID=A0A5C2SG73_9APHY|nr:hypothetical protein L227DRAFT_431969 [Lentinus tigrinus ALCF2SS1-6]RPD77599.1 hypothetical protein L226DRAFT_326850 [Lentinus tigrinus ALCF2SS1-7]